MERENRGNVCSIGMFNLFKGIGILLVIFTHAYEFFELYIPHEFQLSIGYILQYLYDMFVFCIMPAFFIISGYGFRKMKMAKCIKKQFSLLIVPYLYTMIAATAIHFLLHLMFYRWLPGSLNEAWRVMGGFVFGLSLPREVFGVLFSSCGPCWYLIALFWGWCILNLILDKTSGIMTHISVAVVVLIGWFWGRDNTVVYCIPRGMVAVGYIYAGYLAKKNKLFSRTLPMAGWGIGFAACIFINTLVWYKTGQKDVMVHGRWLLGPISIILDGIYAFLILYIFLSFNRYSNKVIEVLEEIGRESLLFFCIHTVENIGILWYILVFRFEKNSVTGLLIVFILKLVIIFIGVKLVGMFNRFRRKRKKTAKHKVQGET